MNDAPDSSADKPEASGSLAPRARPGFRSATAPLVERAQLFAGVLRAVLGAAGLFASVLYLPIHVVTPVLSGVSILMMVMGCTSTWRAARPIPALRIVPRVLVAACVAAAAAAMLLTSVYGAGAFGPVAAARRRAAAEEPPTVRFETR